MSKVEKRVAGITFVADVPTKSVAGHVGVPAAVAHAIEVAIACKLITHGIVAPDAFAFIRKAAKLRAADLAQLLDVDPKSVSRWETGEVEIPRPAWATLAGLFVERARVPAMSTAEVLSAAASPRVPKAPVRIRAA